MPHGGAIARTCAVLALSAAVGGCCSTPQPSPKGLHYGGPLEHNVPIAPPPIPRELQKAALPDYVIEPPDILLLEAVRVMPRSPYRIAQLDTVDLRVDGALPERPIDGVYTVEGGGTINLGPPYGTIRIGGMTLEEATAEVQSRLSNLLQSPAATMYLVETAAAQQISGEHIVGPDGMVTLGIYGKVFVTGMTQRQARQAIETHLSAYLDNPQVSVDLFAYNSKVYYIITEGAGLGDGVVKLPVTGNETVLDAIAEINGLESVSSKHIWVARPSPLGGPDQILPVNWQAITARGRSDTNYQLMPGDRLFVREDKLVATDTFVSKVLSPLERIAGFITLGTQSVSGLRFFQRGTSSGNFIP